jgi:hypothetical protein
MSTRRNWAEDDSSDDDDEPSPAQPSPKVEEKNETVPSPASAVRSPPSPNMNHNYNPNYNMPPNRGGIGYSNMDRGPPMNYSPNQGPPRGRGPPPSYSGSPSNLPPRAPNDGRMNPNWNNNQINNGYGMARGPPQMGPGPMGPMDRPQNGDSRYARGDMRGDYRGDARGDVRGD